MSLCLSCSEDPKQESKTPMATSPEGTPSDQVEKPQKNMVSTVELVAKDGVKIKGDLYLSDKPNNPFILLFHQASFSRGEYLEIAPRLNELGFSCIAIDQRSGEGVHGVLNTTHADAVSKNKPTDYADAVPDLTAAIDYTIKTFAPEKLVLWGSSYSASLVFILGNTYKDDVDALVSFSPGEYFKYEDKKIEDFAKTVTCPVFISSSKAEVPTWQGIYNNLASEHKLGFEPTVEGVHGSSALLKKNKGHGEYWEAVVGFLKKI